MNRREFMYASAGLAVLGLGAFAAPRFRLAPKNRRYVVTTEWRYWNVHQQGIDEIPVQRVLDLPGVGALDRSRPYTIVTSVNDDGSDLRRIALPGMYHSALSNPGLGLVYLIGNYNPNSLVALQADTLEIVEVANPPTSDGGRAFGGHGICMPGGDTIAVSMNQSKAGNFDQISILDARTLRELQSFSSYGFDAHEIRLSPDETYFVCGHYGSYLGRGPYGGLGVYDISADKAGSKEEVALGYRHVKEIYPSSVTFVHAKSGERLKVFTEPQAGQNAQEGHATCDDSHRAYLSSVPSLVEEARNWRTDPHFQPGLAKPRMEDPFFSVKVRRAGQGICVDFDPVHREVIVPQRGAPRTYVTAVQDGRQRQIDYDDDLPTPHFNANQYRADYIGGLALHPDGRHYVLSTREGFLVFSRGTHQLNPAMSFPLKLLTHSHMLII
ncbi:MAG: hypothetical protein ACXVB9_04930 [Bdellovibrionota bacterium]